MNGFPINLLFTILALVLVLILAWFAIRMLALMTSGKLRNGRLRVTYTMPLGSREKLVLVECDDREYLLGVTANGISLIDQQTVNHLPTSPASDQPQARNELL
jgi:flagellar biosynthetic protein FliO